MSYNKEEFPRYVRTAGKITVLTAVVGLFVFIAAFVLDVGQQELSKVSAQTATTTLTVLNTPPQFALNAYENPDSATSTPTNSGTVQTWQAVGVDSNDAPYFLLVCSTNASPTPQASGGTLGTAPPSCDAGAIQWGVSPAASSGDPAIVSTTTAEAGTGQFAEVNTWYAWVCDDDPFNPRCNNIPVQGPTSTVASTSPFHVNNRPVLTSATNTGPVDPGEDIDFTTVSSDPDTVGGEDNIYVLVCSSNTNYSSSTNTCTDELASSTIAVTDNASTTRTITIPTRDQTYSAFLYLFDEHNHEATNNPIAVPFDVNNVAPFVLSGNIEIYGQGGVGTDLTITVPGGETPSSTLNFTVQDNNSCLNAASSSEIVGYEFSIFRSGVGTTSCDSAGEYNPNNCYPSSVSSTTVWTYSCTATTTCASPLQDNIEYTCDFPLWFVADPTDAGPNTPAALAAQNWSAAVTGTDDDAATGVLATTSSPVEMISATYIGILDNAIAYAPTEPGFDTGGTNATSVAQNLGNTGLDQQVQGDDMCGTYTTLTPCSPNPTSTIPADQQEFATTTFTYGAGNNLSSTTAQEAELNVAKTTSTSTPNTGTTYWGIAVPIAITLAGNYTGLNTFTAVTAEPADW